MKIVSVIGARPQLIKAAVIARSIRKLNAETPKSCQHLVLHTGQHYDPNMSERFFQELDLPEPAVNLGVNNDSHAAMTAKMMVGIEKYLRGESPDWVLVYGDTNSTLAGSLAAVKSGFRLAHVEAGLRCGETEMPEEINRIACDRISHLLFCPTMTAYSNLLSEGAMAWDAAKPIWGQTLETLSAKTTAPLATFVGDVMFDSVLFYLHRARRQSRIMQKTGLNGLSFILATIHRSQNTDSPQRLGKIWQSLCQLAEEEPVVFPMHPRTKNAADKLGLLQKKPEALQILPPLGYLDLLALMDSCRLVITDSGGVQKEAFFLDKPSLIVRESTEWVELLQTGLSRLVPADAEVIAREALNISNREAGGGNLFGDGRAGEKVCRILLEMDPGGE